MTPPPPPITARSAILDTLQVIQTRLSGSDIILEDNDLVIPSLAGFDSLCGLEASVLVGGKLGCVVTENIFVSEDGKKAMTLFQAIKRLETLVEHTGSVR